MSNDKDDCCVTGFTATIKIGINAHSKEEAEKKVKQWISALECPVWIEGIE